MIRLPVILVFFGLTLFSRFALSEGMQTFAYAGIQAGLILFIARQKLVTNLGAFLILYFIVYAIRPIYIYLESDFSLLNLFLGRTQYLDVCSEAAFWATCGLLFICAGHAVGRIWFPLRPPKQAASSAFGGGLGRPKQECVILLLGLQAASIVFLLAISGEHAGSLYGASGGAYTYLLPQALQAAQILVVSIFAYNHARFHGRWKNLSIVSIFLFLAYTYLMKDVSIFRGFYITGAIAAVMAVYYARTQTIPYWLLLVPSLLLLPIFRAWGELRWAQAEGFWSETLNVLGTLSPQSWWSFFDVSGDMNVFDTLVAAFESSPRHMPYLFAWIYPVLHFIPRAIWPGKPEWGMLVDFSFMKDLPYTPGLIGFYYLDGGLMWMLASCFVTGVVFYLLDRWLFGMAPGYLKAALYGIVLINSFAAARGYLHFSVAQYFYMIAPVAVLMFVLTKFGMFEGRRGTRLYGRGPSPQRVRAAHT